MARQWNGTIFVTWGLLLAGGCFPDLSMPWSVGIACQEPKDCPEGSRCVDIVARCLPTKGDDGRPPVFKGTPGVTPQTGGPTSSFTVTFVVDEELAVPPLVRWGSDGPTWTLKTHDQSTGGFSHGFVLDDAETLEEMRRSRSAPDAGNDLWEIQALLVDVFGNSSARTVATVELDIWPPAFSELAWVGDPQAAGPVERLSFLGYTVPNTVVERVWVADQSERELGAGAFTTRIDGSGAAAKLVIEGWVDPQVLSLDTTITSITAVVVAHDEVGNQSGLGDAALSYLLWDDQPPSVAWTKTPADPHNDRAVSFEFASSDADVAGFVCALNVDVAVGCVSPWSVSVAPPGPHSVSITAIDGAGNRSLPLNHAWSVVPEWSSVVSGPHGSCGIATDSSLWCWGRHLEVVFLNEVYQEWMTPTPLSGDLGWFALAVGGGCIYALRQGEVSAELWMWGTGPAGDGSDIDVYSMYPRQVPGTWASITVGEDVRCAIDANEALHCWGDNVDRAVGDGDHGSVRLSPVEVAAGSSWMQVSTSGEHTCAIKIDGTLWCWGRNSHGQLGDDSQDTAPTPVLVSTAAPGNDWLAVRAGGLNTCGLRGTEGAATVWCWGASFGRQPSIEGNVFEQTPVEVLSTPEWIDLSVNGLGFCAVSATGEMQCAGNQRDAQLLPGDGPVDWNADSIVAPIAAPTNGWLNVSLGSRHGCGFGGQGKLSCWGTNENGQLARGWRAASRPWLMGPSGVWSALSMGMGGTGGISYSVTCGIRSGDLSCWGHSDDVVDGSETGGVPAPSLLSDDGGWQSLSVASTHGCVLGSSGLACWGRNDFGQLGNGDASGTAQPLPGAVPLPTGHEGGAWANVVARDYTTLAIVEEGAARTLWAFGSYGGSQRTPVQVGSDDQWVSVTIDNGNYWGIRKTVAATPSNSLWYWAGAGATPSQKGQGEIYEGGWTTLVAGSFHRCGLREGELWCWGMADSVVMGDPGDPYNIPRRIDDKLWTDIASGGAFMVGIRTNGTLWCLGNNANNVCGVGAETTVVRELTKISERNDWVGVWAATSFGNSAACAMASGGVVYCGGYDVRGMSGDGLTWGPMEVGCCQ